MTCIYIQRPPKILNSLVLPLKLQISRFFVVTLISKNELEYKRQLVHLANKMDILRYISLKQILIVKIFNKAKLFFYLVTIKL